MNCQQARQLLPLWIGHDLADATDAEALQAHLNECRECSQQQLRLQECLEALQSISTVSLAAESHGVRPSLWPRMAAVLKSGPRRRDQFNGWIPASAMALAAALMVAVSAVQVRREIETSLRANWGRDASTSSGRDLFATDARFAPGARRDDEVPVRGLVVQPAEQAAPNF